MRTLTKEAETKLLRAIENAATFVNSGLEPNAAIVKSATESGIPAGHINLMVHAYNTGRTTKQRETGGTTIEKAADFQLADAATVLQTLYPETVKTSAQLKTAQIVSTEYAISAAGMLARRKDALRKTAAAKTQILSEKTYTPPPRDEHAAAMRGYSQKKAAQRVLEEQRREATVAYNKAAAALDELGNYFRVPGNMPFGAAVREVGLRFGDAGVSALKKVAAVYPHFEKQADTNKTYFGDNVVYTLVQDVIEAVNDYVVCQKKYAAALPAEAPAKPEPITGSILYRAEDEPLTLKQAAGFWPPVTPPVTPTGSGATGQKGGEMPEFKANLMPALATAPIQGVGAAMGMKTPQDVDPAALAKKHLNAMDDPDHNATLKSIKAKGLLHDLIMNDPVVSGYDPQDVAMAFNDISELAPGLVDSPGMVRAVLRKRLEAGQLADFDVKQLLEMDKLRAERDKIVADARASTFDTI